MRCASFLRDVRFDGIAEAIEQGHLDAVAITASGYTAARSVTFFQGRPEQKPWARVRRIGRATRLDLDHLMASTAVPLAVRWRDTATVSGAGSARTVCS
jgi:hypothetical protein